jgi:uncharacterized protein (DUF736 family)
MAIIGKFSLDNGIYTGTIETLTCAPAAVRIAPVAHRPHDRVPDYRVYRGGSELGAAWAKIAKNGRSYLIVTLDDPAFGQPIQCRLVESGDTYALLWSR